VVQVTKLWWKSYVAQSIEDFGRKTKIEDITLGVHGGKYLNES
jgi:hypothetical protein